MNNGIDPKTASIYEQLGMAPQPSDATPKDELGQDAFLELMTTQLQNQDPFQPMENGEFLGQMAQFGTVSGISELQKSFDSMAGSLTSNRALQASVMVGREVLVPSNTARLDADTGLSGAVVLHGSATNVAVGIYTPANELVHTIQLGPQGAGTQRFAWDGLLADGTPAPPGSYQLRAEGLVIGGAEALETLAAGNVDSVSLGNGGADFTLHVAGIGDVRLGDIRQISDQNIDHSGG